MAAERSESDDGRVSLGLKVYYLRTREKGMNQTDVAQSLGVRQATISHIENDLTAPHWSLLVNLCRFFDVTPTYFADEQRGVVPRPTERWGLRDALVTIGMSVEVSRGAISDLEDGQVLCRLEPEGRFYDDEAAEVRRLSMSRDAGSEALEKLRAEHAARELRLMEELQAERQRYVKRRRR